MCRLMGKKEVGFLIWKGTVPVALINVCLDVLSADTKKRGVDGLRNGMCKFDMGRVLIVALNHSETISVEEGVMEFLLY